MIEGKTRKKLNGGQRSWRILLKTTALGGKMDYKIIGDIVDTNEKLEEEL